MCKYCNEETNRIKYNEKYYWDTFKIKGNILELELEIEGTDDLKVDKYTEIEINYCPFCGRDLTHT